MKTIARVAICFFVLFCTAARSEDAPYRIIKIGVEDRDFGGGNLNDAGQVVFWVDPVLNSGMTYDLGAAFLYEQGTLTNLGGLGGLATQALSINEVGQIVGKTENPESESWGFFYEKETGMQILTQAGEQGSIPHAINDLGQIVGISNSTGRAFLLDDLGEVVDLGVLGNKSSITIDVNNKSQIVGGFTTVDFFGSAFLYENGQLQDLGSLGGFRGSVALAINGLGQIVGTSSVGSEENEVGHAFFYDATGGMRDIGEPGEFSVAEDINNLGQIVGWRSATNDESAFLYDQENGRQYLIDLIDPESGWDFLTKSYAINDRGQILGRGIIDGKSSGFLMTPVPEPSTLLLASFGILILFFFKRQENFPCRCRSSSAA